MTKILFVDDDRFFSSLYLEHLQSHYEVLVCYEADTALKALQNDTDIAAAVIDVMMPPPSGFEHETHDGFTTGVWILGQCRDAIAARRIPIILFTNRSVAYVEGEAAYLQIDPQLIQICAKVSVRAADLPHTVGKLIARR